GGIFKTTDGGATWNQQSAGSTFTGTTSFPNSVYFYDANNGFILGDPDYQSSAGYFEIYTTSDGGTTWTRVPKANIPTFISGETGLNNVFEVRGATVWFTTTRGRVFKSVNSGLNWTVANSGAKYPYIVAFADSLNGLVLDTTITTTSGLKRT